ncbi:transcriptional regulator [Halobacteriales archaeon QS_4_69_34]|nr:MAG: transcriptional regulator [Halobacteriales archaeon QS_4_69_34]
MTKQEEWEDLNKHVQAQWTDETTPFERVYEVVETTREGASAATIAERALVSEPTARRHCNALVNTGFAATGQDGRTTLYKRDEDQVLLSRIHDLRERADREELLNGIERMKTAIREYEVTHDAISPEELARELSGEDGDGWADVTAWKTTRRNLAVAQAALAYDEASEQLTA